MSENVQKRYHNIAVSGRSRSFRPTMLLQERHHVMLFQGFSFWNRFVFTVSAIFEQQRSTGVMHVQ